VREDQTSDERDQMSSSTWLPRSKDGYEPAATDKLLDELGVRQAQLVGERDEMRARIEELEADLGRNQAQEQLLGKAFLSAAKHAETIREAARREAELILRKARREALSREAQSERQRVLAEREVVRLRRITDEVQASLKSLLAVSLEQLRVDAEEDVSSSQPANLDDALGVALETALEHEGAGQSGPGAERSETNRGTDPEARESGPWAGV
jgi:cell division septum initiation protein DivIVA